jgi:hypothetical protein
MMFTLTAFAQQSLNWFDETRAFLFDFWLWLVRFVRTGRIGWVIAVVVAFLIYQRFFKK